MEIDKILKDLSDLHLHLGSSSTPHFLWELAHEQGIRLPEKNYWKFINSVTISEKISNSNYHKRFDLTQLIQSSPYAIEKSVHYAISTAYRKADVRTIEIKFNPMRRNKEGEQDLDKTILSAAIGMKKACIEYPVKAGLIIELDRRYSKKQNQILIEKAIDFMKEGIVGVDISGPDNEGFSFDEVSPLFKKAKKAGLGITIHTGEFTPAKEIWEVVEKIAPHRIGHGIHCVSDKKLMQKLSKEKIILELCPTSNVTLGMVKNWDEIKKIVCLLKDNGVLFTVNTDSPEFYGIDVKKELQNLYNRKILEIEDIKNIINLSKTVSFI